MLTAPLFLFFWLHPGLALAAAAYIGRNSLGTVSGALENTFAMEIMPARLRGVVASWRSFAFNAAWSLGSLIAGVVVAALGYDVVFIAGAGLTLVGSALYFARFAAQRRP
jgi:predicted MFS family arabinose efflux permease